MNRVTTQTRPTPGYDDSLPSTEDWINRRASEQATRAANARQTSGRRRFVDPTTCEREYSQAEMEFMFAMNEYKKKSGRMFPTWSEVLEVLRDLGYEKVVPIEPAATHTTEELTVTAVSPSFSPTHRSPIPVV